MNGWSKFNSRSLTDEALYWADMVIDECKGGNIRNAAEAWGRAYAYGWILYRNYGIDLDEYPDYVNAREVYYGYCKEKEGA